MTNINSVDIVLINPGDRRQIYQKLGPAISAIEPPFWIGLIATFLRNKDITVKIIDSNAENISPEETAKKVAEINPILSAVIVYGSQPSASTQTMTIAGKICKTLYEQTNSKVAIGGLHPSALPEQTMNEESVDYLIDGEGPYTLFSLINVLKNNHLNDLNTIPGLWYKDNNKQLKSNERAPDIKDLDQDLSVVAWDLLPMDKYRAHNWHCFDNPEERSPYAAIYTSLGCPYSCVFCCINAPFNKPGIRYRSPEKVIEEIDILVNKYGVKNIKIVDELFVLKEAHYMKIVELILKRKYDLNIWAYARVDTVKEHTLAKMKKAGFNWFALGIESANPDIRDGASKRMKENDINKVVKTIQDAGISVIGNFIFGLPDETIETMQETLNLALELNCEFINFYCAMAYPGSKLYEIACKENWNLPDTWHAFSQHSYEALPLPTKHESAKNVINFRDNAFHEYSKSKPYLDMLEKKFGKEVKDQIIDISKIRLKRKILEKGVY